MADYRSWRKRAARVMEMGWGELCTRGSQEIAKRWDATLYRLGIPFGRGSKPAALESHGHFFFAPEDVASLTGLLREKLPLQVEEIIQRAERACRHHFDLLGHERLDYGPEIDWHLDVVHGKRAPHKPWFQIRYLDFDEVGDAKITWELNRHQHLVLLAKAYRLTGEERFVTELLHQWYHWQRENPYPIGINWASSLEVAFRVLSWIWVRHLLQGCPVVPEGFPADLDRALAISGRHIERFLSTYFSQNTHLLGEGVGLFFLGTLCPQLHGAERWQQRGWEIVLEEAKRQVQADGVHFEQSIYYHVYALDFFLHARQLAAANQVPIPGVFDQTLVKMLNFLCRVGQAGAPPRLGDDDGGRVFDPQRNRAEHMLDPLATGAALWGRADFKAIGRSLREETIWLLGWRGVEEFEKLPVIAPSSDSCGFASSGIYLMACSKPTAQQLTIHAGPMGHDTAGHSHAGALGIHLAVNGREWLEDPGTFVYVSDGPERDAFRGTAAHNTLQVDGLSQVEPVGPFAWSTKPEVCVERWVTGQGFNLLVANHNGYSRLPQPVVHRRCVFHRKSRFWLVVDFAQGEGAHQLELFWHLAPGLLPLEKTPNFIYVAERDQFALALLTVEGHNWSQDLGEGWEAPAYGKKEACSRQRFRKRTQLPVEFATLLLPIPSASAELGHLVQVKDKLGEDGVHAYLYRTAQESHWFVFAEREKRWEVGPWASDASFLYGETTPEGRVRYLALSGGSLAEKEGKRLLAAPQPLERWEWLDQGDREQVLRAEGEAFTSPQETLSGEQKAVGVRKQITVLGQGVR